MNLFHYNYAFVVFQPHTYPTILSTTGVRSLHTKFHTPLAVVFPFGSANWRYWWAIQRMTENRFLVLIQNEAVDRSCYSISGTGMILDSSSPGRMSNFLIGSNPRWHSTSWVDPESNVSPTHLQQLEQVHGLQPRDVTCSWSRYHLFLFAPPTPSLLFYAVPAFPIHSLV